MSVRRSLVILTLVVLLSPLIIFSMSVRGGEAQNAEDNRTLQAHTVERGRVEAIVSAIGTIEADQVVNLSFLTAGRVAEIYVQPGDFIFAGEPLLKLDDTNQRIAYEQAVLSLERAQLELDELRKPVSEDDIRLAQASLDSAWGAYLSAQNAVSPEDIRAAELAYEQALAAEEQAQSRPGAFGGNNLENAQAGAASFNAEIARLQLENLRTVNQPQLNAAYARVVQAQRELERVEAGIPQAQIDRAALAVRQAETALERAETALNRTTLTAPFDGIVSNLAVETGALIAPGFAVIELTDASPLRLTVKVDEVDIRLIRVGMEARVQLDALPGVTIPARVEQVAVLGETLDGVVSYNVDLTLDDPDQRARVGMTTEASIIVDAREDVLKVPNIYIRLDRQGSRAFAQVIDADAPQPNTLKEIEVTLGLQGQDESEILAGLQAGEVIAIDISAGSSIFGE